MKRYRAYIQSDKAGILSATLCMVHCLIIPLLFLAKVSYTDSNANHLPAWWEKLDYIFLVISFWAVYHSAQHTPYQKIKIALWSFFSLLATAIIFEATLHWLAYFASAGLIVTHLANIKLSRRAKKIDKKNLKVVIQ